MRGWIVCVALAGCAAEIGGAREAAEPAGAVAPAPAMTPADAQSPVDAQSAPEAAAAAPYLCGRGRLLYADDFDGPALARGWNTGLGTWSVDSGAVRAAEEPADGHAAIAKRPLAYHDAIDEVTFRLVGATLTGVEMDWDRAGGDDHVCRVEVGPTAVRVRKDGAATRYLDTRRRPAAGAAWHRLHVEVRGPRLLAVVDDTVVAQGEDPGVDRDKRYIGLGPVAGAAAQFDELRVWECVPTAR